VALVNARATHFFQYEGSRQLTTIVAPTGCVTKHGYSFAGAGSPHTMVHFVEDPRGFRTTYMYNADRYVMSMAAGTGVWNYTFVHGGWAK
jgi:YD repeat-containing protein